MLPEHDSQIEAVCADGLGRVLLLQETPPRIELIDPKALKVVASIDLAVEGRGEIARAWADPRGSRGLVRGGALADGKRDRLKRARGKPEGIAFTAQGRARVGLDRRKPCRNLLSC